MKTLLVGNGINIQFGGKAYTSQFNSKLEKLQLEDRLFYNIRKLSYFTSLLSRSKSINLHNLLYGRYLSRT